MSEKCGVDCLKVLAGALKSISNKGSHSEKIKVNNEEIALNLSVILDAYDALSQVFYELYLKPNVKKNIEKIGKKYE